MRLLLTGATGFIGRSLVTSLLDRPDTQLSLLLRPHHQKDDPEHSLIPPAWRWQTELLFADLRDPAAVKTAVSQARPDVVIHLAAAGVTDPFLDIETAVAHNLHGSLNLLRACFEHGPSPSQFISGRTPGELSGMNVYAASKAAAWSFCRMFARTLGWPIHGAMIFQAYGPGQPEKTLIPSAIKAARAGEDFPMTAGSQTRDWIYLEDVAAGLQSMIGADLAPAVTLQLGTGTATSVVEVARKIYALVDRGGRVLPGALPGRPGEEPLQVAGAEAAAQATGWRAAYSLDDGLRQLIAAGHN